MDFSETLREKIDEVCLIIVRKLHPHLRHLIQEKVNKKKKLQIFLFQICQQEGLLHNFTTLSLSLSLSHTHTHTHVHTHTHTHTHAHTYVYIYVCILAEFLH